ncbi:hypothetical protein BGZ92_001480 [Podila epicladia]|nr:hypothetical protein BGZ92_001480 [Podila epicladia]
MARLKAMFTPRPHPHHHTLGPAPAPAAPVANQVRAVKRSLFRRTPRAHNHPTTHTRRRNFLRGAAQAPPVAAGGHHHGHHGHGSPLASLKAMFRPRRSHRHR